MDNNGQTLYDLSLTTLNYIDSTKDLNIILRRQALKKIIARCWSWRKRTEKNQFLSKIFSYLFDEQIKLQIKVIFSKILCT